MKPFRLLPVHTNIFITLPPYIERIHGLGEPKHKEVKTHLLFIIELYIDTNVIIRRVVIFNNF